MVLGSEKLDKKLHELEFKTCVPGITKFIKEYGEDVRIHRQLKKDNSCPALPESTGTGSLENDTLKEYMEEVHTMFYVTSLEWTEKGAVKKVETLIKQTLPFSIFKSNWELLLATDEGWAVRKILGKIFDKADGVPHGHMTWWDGFYSQPKDVCRLDEEDIPADILGESKGNRIVRIGHIEDTRAKNVDSIKKIKQLVLQPYFGLLTTNSVSASVAKPFQELCEVSDYGCSTSSSSTYTTYHCHTQPGSDDPK